MQPGRRHKSDYVSNGVQNSMRGFANGMARSEIPIKVAGAHGRDDSGVADHSCRNQGRSVLLLTIHVGIWNHAWRGGDGPLYNTLINNRLDVIDWTTADPKRGRVFWNEVLTNLRSQKKIDQEIA